MRFARALIQCFLSLLCLALALPAAAQGYPAPKEGTWTARNFRFHTGEVLPEVKLHYRTIGSPSGEPVLILHGTTGSGASMLAKSFADELYGPGQPLDASRYFIILPDALGAGKSTKPSDGLRAKFPRYNYDDMVSAQFRLVTEGLGIRHLRLVLGNSMGGMQAWMWGVKYPGFVDALVPMASLPVAMSGRNWMMRRFLVDAIRNDPDYKGGEYTAQPAGIQRALVHFALATNGGNQALYRQAPTREKADALIAARLAQPFRGDANDTLYQWESSFDYDVSAGLERITAVVVAINSADDERNPPELGVMEKALARIRNARQVLIPGSPETSGHGTTMTARHWKKHLEELLLEAPRGGAGRG